MVQGKRARCRFESRKLRTLILHATQVTMKHYRPQVPVCLTESQPRLRTVEIPLTRASVHDPVCNGHAGGAWLA